MDTPEENKKHATGILFPQDLRDFIQERAKNNERSFAREVIWQLRQYRRLLEKRTKEATSGEN